MIFGQETRGWADLNDSVDKAGEGYFRFFYDREHNEKKKGEFLPQFYYFQAELKNHYEEKNISLF